MIIHILYNHARCQKRRELRIKLRIKTRKRQVNEEHQKDTKVQQAKTYKIQTTHASKMSRVWL